MNEEVKRSNKKVMASQTTGIQQLLAAEKKAGEKITEARKRKAQRLKEAKYDAQIEINKIKEEQEIKFKEFESEYLGSKESIEEKIKLDTTTTLKNLEDSVNKNKEHVINRLLQLVCDIQPQLHRNLLLQKEHNI
ncbi:V-type proton ATPase subunit G [Strongyloides ratti]|uniref:V-type proton ATPase subunit G n=1 Tax=Strongyloides ratti TaxID=34506 RepID=A0A090L9B8_STRRB|nr:V-type proton ATPase subunit G [Strongyloides ratti]CEF64698.1 V-type proton ATPase subunit G [Strongyloides ratti]